MKKKLRYLIDSRDIEVLLHTRPPQWIFIMPLTGRWMCSACGRGGRSNIFTHSAKCSGQAHWDAIGKLEKAIHGGGR